MTKDEQAFAALRDFLKEDRRYAFRVGHDQKAVDERIAKIDQHLAFLNDLEGRMSSR